MRIRNRVLQFDQFGALFQLSIQGDDPEFRSMIGAISSIFLYATCFGYLVYLLIIWITDQNVPIQNFSNEFQEGGKTFKFSDTPFYFTIEAYDNETLQQYKNKLLYEVKTQFYFDGEVYESENYHANCINKFSVFSMDFFKPTCPNITDKYQSKLSQNYIDRNYDDYLGYYFYPCNQSVIVDPFCMSDIEQQNFLLNLQGDARITIVTQEYDLEKQSIKQIPFDYYLPLNYKQRIQVNLILTVTHITVEKGIIFPVKQEFEIISNIEIKPQSVYRDDGNAYAELWLSLDRRQQNIQIVYPKLPEILAQFQSIFSWIMMIGIIITKINNRNLKKNLLKQTGNMYFTNYNIFDKPKSEYTSEETFLKAQSLKKRIEKNLYAKFNFINIMYEISRIQIAIQTLINKQQLNLIQQTKYTLFLADERNNQKEIFNENDFYLLSQYEIKQQQKINEIKKRKITIQNRSNQVCDFNDESNQLFQLQCDQEKQSISQKRKIEFIHQTVSQI